MKKVITVFPLLIFICVFISCASGSVSREKPNSVMYGMIYDYENNPVKSVAITIDDEDRYESDVMGHFIINRYKPGEHAIRMEKYGYEPVEDVFEYDPMSILYYRMVTATQLVKEAEHAVDKYNYDKAIECLDRALALEQFRYDALYLKATVYLLTGDFPKARQAAMDLRQEGYTCPYIDELHKLIEQESSE